MLLTKVCFRPSPQSHGRTIDSGSSRSASSSDGSDLTGFVKTDGEDSLDSFSSESTARFTGDEIGGDYDERRRRRRCLKMVSYK